MSADRPPNLHVLPSFLSQDLLPDGVHLTPVSGLHYVLHIFDQTEAALSLSTQNSDSKLVHVQEAVRQHDDRLVFLETRHDRLSCSHDVKVAADAEFRDWMINKSEEDCLTILGLPRLKGDFTPRDWQVAAKKQVSELIDYVLNLNKIGLHYKVLYVGNPNRHRTGVPALNVKMNSVETSSRIRELYSGFFSPNNPLKLPSRLKSVSVRNKVTHDTRIRISILQELGSNYKSSNPGSVVKVKGHVSRPLLFLQPPSGSDSRSQTFNFIEAVTTLPPVLSDESLGKIFGKVGGRHKGGLRAHFVILNDDDRERCHGLARRPRGPAAPPSSSASASVEGRIFGGGSGMDLEAGFLESLRSAPPPPPVVSFRVPDSETRARSLSTQRSPSPDRRGSRHPTPERGDRHVADEDTRKRRRRSESSSSSSSASGSSSASSSSSTASDRSRSRKHGRSSKHRKSKKSRKSGKSGKSSKSSKSGKSGKSGKSKKSPKEAPDEESEKTREK